MPTEPRISFRDSSVLMMWASLLAKILGGIVIVTIAIAKLPASDSALWLLFYSAVLIITAIADFGFQPTFTRFIAYLSWREGKDRLFSHKRIPSGLSGRGVLKTMKVFYALAGIVAIIIGIGMGSWILASNIDSASNPKHANISWMVVVVATATQVFGGKYIALLHGSDLIAPQKYAETITDLTTSMLAVLILLGGGHLLALVVVLQLGVIARVLVNLYLVRSLLAEENNPLTSDSSSTGKLFSSAWATAWRSGAGVLLAYLSVHGTLLAVSNLYSAESLAALLLSVRLISIISSFANVPFYSKIPKMSMLFASGEVASLGRMMRAGMLQTLLLYAFGTGLTGLLGTGSLRALGSDVQLLPIEMWFALSTAFLFERWGALHLQGLAVTNTIYWHVVNGCALFGLLLLNLLLIDIAVQIRVVLVFFLSYALIAAPLSWFLNSRAFNLSFITFESRCLLPAAMVLAGFACVAVLF